MLNINIIIMVDKINTIESTVEKVLNWYTGENIMSPRFKDMVYEHILPQLIDSDINNATDLTDILRHSAKDVILVETGKETYYNDFETYYIKFSFVNYKTNRPFGLYLYSASIFKG